MSNPLSDLWRNWCNMWNAALYPSPPPDPSPPPTSPTSPPPADNPLHDAWLGWCAWWNDAFGASGDALVQPLIEWWQAIWAVERNPITVLFFVISGWFQDVFAFLTPTKDGFWSGPGGTVANILIVLVISLGIFASLGFYSKMVRWFKKR